MNVLHTTLDIAGSVKGNFFSFNLRIELGYQFVFWKRLTLDFVVIRPAMSYYGGAVDITGEIQLDKLNDINSEHYQKIKEKYPMVGDFVVNKSFK